MSKGISEIVTAVLLILIVTAVGIGLLMYSTNYFSYQTSDRNLVNTQATNKLLENFIIANAMVENNEDVNVSVYNYGSISMTIVGLYVNGNLMNITNVAGVPLGIKINPGTNQWVNSSTSLNSAGSTVSIEVVSSLGNYYENYYTVQNPT